MLIAWIDQQPQHIGMPFIIMQQVQPAISMAAMQSQQHWIILQQAASPEVHVTMQPVSVISTLHMPIIMLQFMTGMPFIIMQQDIMPPAIMLQRFCMVRAAMASSHMHIIFMPLAIFSTFMVQRGTIIMFMPAMLPAMPGAIEPGIIPGFIPGVMFRIMPMSIMPIIEARSEVVVAMIQFSVRTFFCVCLPAASASELLLPK
jgi:hypothetical protein